MSFGVSALASDATSLGVSARIGTNGSQEPLCALLLAAYSLTDAPEACRIRGSWWGWRPGMALEIPRSQMPPYADLRTLRGARAALAYNFNECTWLEVRFPSIRRAQKLRPVACPDLAILVRWIELCCDSKIYYGRLTPEETRSLRDAVARLTPQVSPSCWAPIVAELLGVLDAALAADGMLGYG